MAGRYVPPHLRQRSQDTMNLSDSAADASDMHKQDLGLRRLADLKLSDGDKRPLHTLFEISSFYGTSTTHSTLHDSAEKPEHLAYVVLFRNANPRWYDDQIIFAHTNINLLPGYAAFTATLDSPNPDAFDTVDPPEGEVLQSEDKKHQGDSTSHDTPSQADDETKHTGHIPVFMEVATAKGVLRRFVFHGFFSLANVQFLKPQSEDLVQMLQQKWQPVHHNPNKSPPKQKERDQAAWKKSLDQEWAIIKMEKVPKENWSQEPQVEILSDEQQDRGRLDRKDYAFIKRSGQVVEDNGMTQL